MTNDRTTIKIFFCILAGFLCLYLFTARAERLLGDEYEMFKVAESILKGKSFSISGIPQEDGYAGERYSKYPLGQIFLNLLIVPKYSGTSKDIDNGAGKAAVIWDLLAISILPALISAMIPALCFLITRRLGFRKMISFAAALITGATTMIWPYSQTFFAEPLLTLCWLAGFYGLVSYKNTQKNFWLLISGFSFGYALITKTTSFLFANIFIIYLFFLISNGRRRLISDKNFLTSANLFFWLKKVGWFGWPFLMLLAVQLWYNHLRFGNIFQFGYNIGRDQFFGFNTPFLAGFYGLLFSPGKSMFLYSPTLILGVLAFRGFYQKFKAEALVILFFVLGHLLVYSQWWAWHGDWSWGPRFLLPVIPFLMLPVAVWFESWYEKSMAWQKKFILSAGVLILLSLFVQTLGLIIPYDNYLKTLLGVGVFEQSLYQPKVWPIRDDYLQAHFIPEFSPIVGHYWMTGLAGAVAGRDSQLLLGRFLNPPWRLLNPKWVPDSSRLTSLLPLFQYNIWWLFASQIHSKSLTAAVAVALTLILISLFFFCQAVLIISGRSFSGVFYKILNYNFYDKNPN